jgi:hypothetical protein
MRHQESTVDGVVGGESCKARNNCNVAMLNATLQLKDVSWILFLTPLVRLTGEAGCTMLGSS